MATRDKNGKPLARGDRVNIPCVIRDVWKEGDHAFVTVETEGGRPPGDLKSSLYLAAGQVEKKED